MSLTRVNVAKSWPTLRVIATQKRDTNAQFISLTADKYKSAQTYEYHSYHRVFVFELKQQSRNYWHVGNPPTCRQMSCHLDTLADTTFSCVCDMTSDVSRHVADTTQNVQKRHADIRHNGLSSLRESRTESYKIQATYKLRIYLLTSYVHTRKYLIFLTYVE